MINDLLPFLACPACESDRLQLEATQVQGEEIEEGRILCGACNAQFPIVNGIPRLLPESRRYFQATKNMEPGTIRSSPDVYERALKLTITHYSSYQGRVFAPLADQLDNWAILTARTGLGPRDFTDRTCLDAGCGVGRMSVLMAKAGAKMVVAMDAGFAVDEAKRRAPHLSNLQWVQGDILRPPLRKAAFDRIVSLGVLHHTREPDRGFRVLSDHVGPEGSLSLYLYPRNYDPWWYARSTRALISRARESLYCEPIRRAVVSCPDSVRSVFCSLMWKRRRLIEFMGRRGTFGRAAARGIEFLTPSDPSYKALETKASNLSRLYDTYSTPYCYDHHLLEVIDWYGRDGRFGSIVVTPYRVSVTGWRKERGVDEPMQIQYFPAKSISEIEARGRTVTS